MTSGELWLADLQAKTTRSLASSHSYHSPIFLAGTREVFGLSGTDVVRIPVVAGQGRKLYSVEGIVKLAGR